MGTIYRHDWIHFPIKETRVNTLCDFYSWPLKGERCKLHLTTFPIIPKHNYHQLGALSKFIFQFAQCGGEIFLIIVSLMPTKNRRHSFHWLNGIEIRCIESFHSSGIFYEVLIIKKSHYKLRYEYTSID